jgi:hypothetical protein
MVCEGQIIFGNQIIKDLKSDEMLMVCSREWQILIGLLIPDRNDIVGN